MGAGVEYCDGWIASGHLGRRLVFWRRRLRFCGDRNRAVRYGGGVTGRKCGRAVQRWSGHRILQRLVDVDLEPRIGLFIQLRTQRSLGEVVGTSTRDLEVDAMRIILRPVEDSGTVQCDDLMTQHVASWCDGGWYYYSPAVVRVSQLVRCPVSCLARSSRSAQ